MEGTGNKKEEMSQEYAHSLLIPEQRLNPLGQKGSESKWKFILVLSCLFMFVLTCISSNWHDYLQFQSEPSLPRAIIWTACGDNIECGRFDVPLDYFNRSLGNASLSVARYPATNRTARLGTILTNPGGPGGSGVEFIYQAGKHISELFDGRFDIVSWDPRGINGTTPRVECFTSQSEQDVYFANTHQEILPDARNLSNPVDRATFSSRLRIADVRNAALARLCHERSEEALKHVGTATVVRDLDRLYTELEGEDEQINFWGFSYGSIVGSYLANMFPNRIGKVVIDGIVNPELWATTNLYRWGNWHFTDTEKALHNFYSACAKAGPDRCALASYGPKGKDLSDTIDNLLEKLYEHPLPVWNATRPGPLTSSMINVMIFTYMYRPRDWPELANNLVEVLNGNGVPVVESFLKEIELDTSVRVDTRQAHEAVICADTPPYPENINPDNVFEDMVDAMARTQTGTTRHFGNFITIDTCQHWKARETERFVGPFNHTLSNVMLIIGNAADPVTPLQNARAVNKMMPNSTRLFVQDGSGHCSIAMTSLCTIKALRAYFIDSKLPENGIVCSVDEITFPPDSGEGRTSSWAQEDIHGVNNMHAYSVEDMRLLEKMRAVGKRFDKYVTHFIRPGRL